MTTQRRHVGQGLGATLAGLVMVLAASTSVAQEAPAVPPSEALEEVPGSWLEAAEGLGVPDPVALLGRFELAEGAVGLLQGSSATETGQREQHLLVVVEDADHELRTLVLPGVRTPEREPRELVTARVLADAAAPPLLLLEIESGPGPAEGTPPERRGFVVNLRQVSLTHDYEATEWRLEDDSSWTHFERAPQVVAVETGRELVLMVDRQNGNGRSSRIRQGLHTWP